MSPLHVESYRESPDNFGRSPYSPEKRAVALPSVHGCKVHPCLLESARRAHLVCERCIHYSACGDFAACIDSTRKSTMKMFIGGEWTQTERSSTVRNPFSNDVVDEVPLATRADVERAIGAAVEGSAIMRKQTAYDRCEVLRRTVKLVRERADEFAETICQEEGKTLAEAKFEVSRGIETLSLSADEAKRIGGETLPLDAAPGGANAFGFTMRVPCGVVVAITPFNFPLNLVCHKVGPAIAAGNAVILKPASDTPLTALKLVGALLDAGLPPLGIQCITGGGREIGDALCSDPRVRKITFTGSYDVGQHICQTAGVKRVTMELGANCPLIVMPDADMSRVLDAVVTTGYGNAGQVCISTQRVVGIGSVYDTLRDSLTERVRRLNCGDPMGVNTNVGPMIREADAIRVREWIDEAIADGAQLLCGGERDKAILTPAVVAEVRPEMKICREELFGPAVGLARAKTLDEAIALANDSRYGLSAAIFTRDIDQAMTFAREAESGNIHINWGPGWRADLMPYGGLKESGIGKEGPRYAAREMTEEKTVVVHLQAKKT